MPDVFSGSLSERRGRRRIEQELMRKKVDRSIIRESIDSYLSEDNEEYQQLLEEIMTGKGQSIVRRQENAEKP